MPIRSVPATVSDEPSKVADGDQGGSCLLRNTDDINPVFVGDSDDVTASGAGKGFEIPPGWGVRIPLKGRGDEVWAVAGTGLEVAVDVGYE